MGGGWLKRCGWSVLARWRRLLPVRPVDACRDAFAGGGPKARNHEIPKGWEFRSLSAFRVHPAEDGSSRAAPREREERRVPQHLVVRTRPVLVHDPGALDQLQRA